MIINEVIEATWLLGQIVIITSVPRIGYLIIELDGKSLPLGDANSNLIKCTNNDNYCFVIGSNNDSRTKLIIILSINRTIQ